MNQVSQIFEWYKQFNKTDVVLKSSSHEFQFEISNNSLPHLLGLQYTTKNNTKGFRLYNFVKGKNDDDIYDLIKKNNPHMLDAVKERLHNFRYFMENLEHSFLYEQTNEKSSIKSDYLLVETKDKKYLQLGIGRERGDKDYLETFIVRKDQLYFDKSTIKEPVESIHKLDSDNQLVPFSFDLEKNRILEEQRRKQMEQLIYRDSDLDGLSDSLEYALGTNPFSADTDGDGIGDSAEVWGGTNPKIDDRKQELQETIEQAKIDASSVGNFRGRDKNSQEKEI